MYDIGQLDFLLLGTIVGLCFLAMFVIGIVSIRDRHRAQLSYVPVEGIVLSQRLIERDSFYEPRVEYEFVLDGVAYKNSNVWAGGSDYGVSLAKANQVLRQFPKGGKVQAFYDPADPHQAFLLSSPPVLVENAFQAFSFFCGLLFVGLFVVAWAAGLFWELIGAHALAVIVGIGLFTLAVRRENEKTNPLN